MEKTVNYILLRWYHKNKRNLPWRKIHSNNLPDPYYVFVSEFMLQQTTVNTVKERFIKFIHKWPNISKLALANESQILKFWSGLGYYTRARNLLKAAKIIHKDFNNFIPKKYEDLISLPGVGDYTAKAILGIAYNQQVFPTDANIERIIVRLFAIKEPITKIKGKLRQLAENFISKNESSNIIQSFMDYGSLICVPRNPKCEICKIKNFCNSKKNNLQLLLPLKIKKELKKPKKYTRAYVLVNEKNEILVRNRPSKGMLASMLEVPNDIWVKNKRLLTNDLFIQKLKPRLFHKGYVHYSFSHFDLETEIYLGKVRKTKLSNSRWIKKSSYSKSGLPTIMKKIVEKAI